MITGRDARGRKVRRDDMLIDDRGRAWRVQATELPLRKRGLARVQSVRSAPAPGQDFSVVRLYLTLRVPAPSQTAAANARRWHRLWAKYVVPAQQRAERQRRRVAVMALRPCPVCRGGWQPCKFKLGLPVWKRKKLRVCSRQCAVQVRKEVRLLQKKQSERDPERVRRSVAWKYLRRESQ